MSENDSQRRLEVLLAEDSEDDALFVREALERADLGRPVRLHVVRDGVEAMEFLRREGPHNDAPRPDYVILDVRMPRKDGIEVLRSIKADPALLEIPVLLLSIIADKAAETVGLRGGVSAYLQKPVRPEPLAETLRILEAARRRDGGGAPEAKAPWN